ncbi:MAG: Gfo/Idh/MocA family oxidoreductase [Burkholderiaceae bacterium]
MLRAGLVGCGKIADGHAEQIRAVGRAELVAVCDSEPLMAEQMGLRHHVSGRYSDLATMLEAERLDVLHVATPPDSHLAIAGRALQSGAHLFIEKPFALTAEDAASIFALGDQQDRRIAVNYLYNFEGVGLQLDQLVRSGELGEIVHVDCHYGYDLAGAYGLAVLSDPGHWVHRLPGKLFHNVLDHVLSKFVGWVDDNFTLKTMAFRQRPATGVAAIDEMPDELRLLLHSGNLTADVKISAHGRPVAHWLKVVGTRRSVEVDYSARTLVFTACQTQPSAIGRLFPAWVQSARYARNGLRNASLFGRSRFHYFDGMRTLLDRFYDAIEASRPLPTPTPDVVRVCRIIDAIVADLKAQP